MGVGGAKDLFWLTATTDWWNFLNILVSCYTNSANYNILKISWHVNSGLKKSTSSELTTGLSCIVKNHFPNGENEQSFYVPEPDCCSITGSTGRSCCLWCEVLSRGAHTLTCSPYWGEHTWSRVGRGQTRADRGQSPPHTDHLRDTQRKGTNDSNSCHLSVYHMLKHSGPVKRTVVRLKELFEWIYSMCVTTLLEMFSPLTPSASI